MYFIIGFTAPFATSVCVRCACECVRCCVPFTCVFFFICKSCLIRRCVKLLFIIICSLLVINAIFPSTLILSFVLVLSNGSQPRPDFTLYSHTHTQHHIVFNAKKVCNVHALRVTTTQSATTTHTDYHYIPSDTRQTDRQTQQCGQSFARLRIPMSHFINYVPLISVKYVYL